MDFGLLLVDDGEALGGGDAVPAPVDGELHLVHQPQPDPQLEHHDVVHQDRVHEQNHSRAAVEDDEDVAEAWICLDEEPEGPGDPEHEGDQRTRLYLPVHLVHRARRLPPPPGLVGRHEGLHEDEAVENDHERHGNNEEEDEGVFSEPAVVVAAQVLVAVVVVDEADEEGDEGEDEGRAVADQVADEVRVLGGGGVHQPVGPERPEQLDPLQQGPGEDGQAGEVDHGGHTLAQVHRQPEGGFIKAEEEEDKQCDGADCSVLDNYNTGT